LATGNSQKPQENSVNARFAASTVCETHWFPCSSVENMGQGRINDTYSVVRTSDGSRFVLQRLNANVFPQGFELMQQTVRVVAHLQQQHRGWVPNLVPSKGGDPFVREVDGGGREHVWRVWEFVHRARVRSQLEGKTQLHNVGAAFGYTHTLLEDLPGALLKDPIPNLFDLTHHFIQLDALTRQQTLSQEVHKCVQQADQLRHLTQGFGDRNRIVHGDCKPQNLMFHDGSDEIACVLDLDTVMRGNWAWDFGDLVRSAALDGQGFSLPRFAALLQGFVRASPTSHQDDAELLSGSPAYISSCLGLRYLTDHLLGDVQFKVQRHGDNLRRAVARLTLAQQLCDERAAMEREARAVVQG
jgi:Ser/Thr protein kinase RdoA (MazF antagonist)